MALTPQIGTFEHLSKFYLKDIIGDGLSVFDGSKDMGRDAVFNGTANAFPSKTAPYSGSWIFQVKHKTTRSKTLKHAEDDLLSITAVHPMREKAVKEFLNWAKADWTIVHGLVVGGQLIRKEYDGSVFYMRKIH